MQNRAVYNVAEARAVTNFLDSVPTAPSGLVIEGVPGIGKTTLWLAALDQASKRGYQVLSACAAAAESVLAYASLADLLSVVDESVLSELPDPQRLALDRVLLRAGADAGAADQRAVAAGFLSVVERLADRSELVLAIDDLQWVDPSSLQVVASAARRLSARVGVLAAVRTDPDRGSGDGASWLQLPRPGAIHRITVPPLSVGALHAVISERLGRSFSRPTMVRIHEISGGNPLYALELARSMDGTTLGAEVALPGSLAELVRTRIGRLDTEVGAALLAVASAAAPTVELVAAAIGSDAGHVVGILEEAERRGIVGIHGQRLKFAHPLLATGVYTDAGPARRRAMHRRLAEIVEEPELQARHLALAAASADPRTLQSLDAAAETARIRGAPAAAAELLDLAVGLDGDTPERRIRSASQHLNAGDAGRAGVMLEETIEQLEPGRLRAEALSLLALVRLSGDSFPEGADLLERSLGDAGNDLALRVPTLVMRAYALFYAGQPAAAMQSVQVAVADAERLGQPLLLSQALGMRAMLGFTHGDGLDEPSLRRALDLEDRQADIPVMLRPSVQNAMLLAWTGQLQPAHVEMQSIRRRCIEHGEENELILVALHLVLIEIWRGNFIDAILVAEDAMERALQLNADSARVVALGLRAMLATYAGRVDEARCDIREALAASQRYGSPIYAMWPTTILGFLEVSMGNYRAALTALEPLLPMLDLMPDGTEIFFASFVPDVAEALVHLGRHAEAERLIERLERNGRRLDRAWMLSVGARCRAILLAARGDVDAASLAAQRAMAEHDRLPMPFERARTQLLLGQLQRRQRHKDAGAATLREALATFEELGTPQWADRVRAELDRANIGPHRTTVLTPSEQRVADLAASGMTNRDVAGALFISPKTVEANLARIYRKLDIHSRAELGRHIGPADR